MNLHGTLRSVTTLVVSMSLGTASWAQTTERASVSAAGAQGNSDSAYPSLSSDGRYVAFQSGAINLVASDTNGRGDVFVRDCQSGTNELVSVASGGAQGNDSSYLPSISADGRYVAFQSFATNLVASDTNANFDVFVRDRQSGTTERVSVSTGGTQGDLESTCPAISADGRYVAFASSSTNLVAGDTNGWMDVFVRDRSTGTTERVSVSTAGAQGNSLSGSDFHSISISADGRYVAFPSLATNLAAGDTNSLEDVFVRDLQSGTTERVSVANGGTQGDGNSAYPSISADGRCVSFGSYAANLVAGDTNGVWDIFVRDRQSQTTEIASVSSGGVQANDRCDYTSISANGRCVVFVTQASNLVAGDTNGKWDVFVHDRQNGTTERANVATGGTQANSFGTNYIFSISADGRYVAFQSDATNLVAGDSNGFVDVFVRDRDTTGFPSLCEPGTAGVTGCPCANPSSGPDRGCDNSAATGGASIAASGAAHLSADTLVFTASGEVPAARSILLQGNAFVLAGQIYGQGVRCAGGGLTRLFVKAASAGGGITAPDLGAGDPSISARSAARGDTILPGQSRWYLVSYRAPNVLGGCPPTSGFNATQTRQATWAP